MGYGFLNRLKVYHLAVISAGAGLILIALPRALPIDTRGVLVCSGLMFASEALSIRLPAGLTTTVSVSVIFASHLLFGAVPAAVVALIPCVVASKLVDRKPMMVSLFNGCQYVLAIFCGAALELVRPFIAAVGHPTLAPFLSHALFLLGFFVANQCLTNLPLAVIGVVKWKDFFVAAGWDGLIAVVTLPLAFVMVTVYQALGGAGMVPLLLPLVSVALVLRLQASLSRVNREVCALYEVSQRLSSVFDLDRVFDSIVDCVYSTLHPGVCLLYAWDDSAQGLVSVREKVWLERDPEAARRAGKWAAARIEEFRKGERLYYVPDTGDGVARIKDAGWHVLTSPLIHEGRLIGGLVLLRRGYKEFTSGDSKLIGILSVHAAEAIDQALLYRKTEVLAATEPMTELLNRRSFCVKFDQELQRAKRTGSRMSVVYLDLDRFKRVNDEHGHFAGDKVIKEFAQLLKDSIREADVAARWGGDEFVVLLPATGKEEAVQVAERLVRAVSAAKFNLDDCGTPVRIGVTAGVASFPDDGGDLKTLMEVADRAMYQRKTT